MKLTKREKILLTFLLILLSAFLYYRFVYQPESSKTVKLQEEYTRKLRVFNQVKRKDERLTEIQGDMNKLQTELTTMDKKISMPIYVPEIIKELDRAAAQKGIQVDSIAFSGNASAIKGEVLNVKSTSTAKMSVTPDVALAAQKAIASQDPAAQSAASQALATAAQSALEQNSSLQPNATGQSSQTPIKGPAGLDNLVIQFSFQGNYTNCIEFIKYYENNERLFRVDSIEISGINDKCSGRATITTFSISADDPKFRYEVDAGTVRSNPFK